MERTSDTRRVQHDFSLPVDVVVAFVVVTSASSETNVQRASGSMLVEPSVTRNVRRPLHGHRTSGLRVSNGGWGCVAVRVHELKIRYWFSMRKNGEREREKWIAYVVYRDFQV